MEEINKRIRKIHERRTHEPRISKVKVRYASGEEEEVEEGQVTFQSAEWWPVRWPRFLRWDIIYEIRRFFMKRRWQKAGQPVVVFPGYHYGCCGKYTEGEYGVPTYEFVTSYWDTWGVCKKGEGCRKVG